MTSTLTSTPTSTRRLTVCRADDLEDNLGVAVLLPDGSQAALFRIPADDVDDAANGDYTDEPVFFAVSNTDPYTGAAVISRGIVGEHDGHPTVASPLLKQSFSLTDGTSTAGDGRDLPVYPVEIVDGDVILHH
ncbi:nitrite reductase (NAD(P)H) small subunit [Corynebacterium nuruki]|uniref:nitrite reductase (NAD(P)H) small subunit n=1 Tax=Corynebacterium nuruki TaxID=1032851 RepID=UPI0039BFEF45